MTATVEKKNESAQAQPIESTRDRPVYIPATDIYEDENAVTVVADVPGVDDKTVEISLENDVLTIKGHTTADTREGFQPLHRGFCPCEYQRAFTLGADVDRAKIKAQVRNGVLTITLPKAAEAQPRKIAVESA